MLIFFFERKFSWLLSSLSKLNWNVIYFQVKPAMTDAPILTRNDKNITTLRPSDSVLQPRVVTMTDQSEITLKGANVQETQAVENMIWKTARDGDGFCLDEFCPTSGYFPTNLFWILRLS